MPPSPTSLPVTVSDQNPTSSEVTISTSYESDKELLEQTKSSVVNEISSTVKGKCILKLFIILHWFFYDDCQLDKSMFEII